MVSTLSLLGVANRAADEARIMAGFAPLGDDLLLIHRLRLSDCMPRGALILFPGYRRNAYEYLERARTLASAQRLNLYAPEFDKRNFPRWRYQRGGVVRRGRMTDPSQCSGHVVAKLVAWVRQQEGRPDLPVTLFGHSAGGQFLSRISAYCPIQTQAPPARIVVANASGHVAARADVPMPYGFAPPEHDEADVQNATDLLRAYLAQPVTIYLGSRDTGRRRLNTEDGAMAQGRHRLERGWNVYHEARRVAMRRDWPFDWRLVVAEGIGHSSRGMLQAPEAHVAIAP